MLQSSIQPTKGDTSQSFTRQGSLRRVLPSEHNKENIFGRQNEEINEFYKTVHQEYIILAEYKMVISENIKGIYVIPSKDKSLEWFGVIFVRSGLYEDGVFRFNITLPDTFPDGEHPKVIFQSGVYHPVINENTNELYLLNGFPVWNKSEHHIWQVLKYIHWIFYYFEASISHAIDQEAAKLFKEDGEAFKRKAKQNVAKSLEQLHDPPPTNDKHYIVFEQYISDLHGPVRISMLTQPDEDRPVPVGHSWVVNASFKPLSRAPSVDSESDS